MRPSPLEGTVTFVGSTLSLNHCQIVRNSDLMVVGLILENQSQINNLVFNGFGVQDANTHSLMPELINLESGSIGQLVLNSLDSSNIVAPVAPDEFSNVGTVTGAGVLATGWEFPDAVMANGVPYISSNSGRPSIKVGGVVEPYTPS